VVCFHGNGETVSDGVACLLQPFLGMGLNVLLATYRGYGASTGEPTLASVLDDAPEVVRALGTVPSRVILYGRSLGSLAALRAADLVPGVAGLILESAIADLLPRVLCRVRPEEVGVSGERLAAAVAARVHPAGILARFPQPVLILHAHHDTLVGVDNAHRLHGWAAGACRLKVFPQGDHNTLLWLNEEEYFDEIRAFVGGLDPPQRPGPAIQP
jgi:pimeloyl-ACP methyl ester carboxylesterase